MLSEPVARITSPAATSEAATLQEIQIDNIHLQQTMQSENATASGSQSMSPRSCVPSNELW